MALAQTSADYRPRVTPNEGPSRDGLAWPRTYRRTVFRSMLSWRAAARMPDARASRTAATTRAAGMGLPRCAMPRSASHIALQDGVGVVVWPGPPRAGPPIRSLPRRPRFRLLQFGQPCLVGPGARQLMQRLQPA